MDKETQNSMEEKESLNPLNSIFEMYNDVDEKKIIYNYRQIKQREERLEQIRRKNEERRKRLAEKQALKDKIDNKLESIVHKVNQADSHKIRLTTSQKNSSVINKVLDAARAFLKEELMIDDTSKVMVAVSGGVDSTVLLDALSLLRREFIFDLSVVHFNHTLRGDESNRDEEFVGNLAKDYGFKFYSSKSNVRAYADKNSISIEFAARTLRYIFFERITRSNGADFLATAHTADDSVETFFINLFRGSGLTGLSGIPAVRQLVKNVQLIRPLIGLRKEDLMNYADERNLTWNEDSTNSLVEFTRNRIRNELIPEIEAKYNPSLKEVIKRTSSILFEADGFITNYVNSNLMRIIRYVDNKILRINIPMLETFEPFIQNEMIQTALNKYYKAQPQSQSTLKRIKQLVDSETGSKTEISNNLVVLKDREDLLIYRKIIAPVYYEKIPIPGKFEDKNVILKLEKINPEDVRFTKDNSVEYFDLDILPKTLNLRNWKAGDKISPLGMEGTIKVSDYLTNNKVSLMEKEKVLVLTNYTDIIWVCGHRINEKFKIKKESTNVLKATFVSK